MRSAMVGLSMVALIGCMMVSNDCVGVLDSFHKLLVEIFLVPCRMIFPLCMM